MKKNSMGSLKFKNDWFINMSEISCRDFERVLCPCVWESTEEKCVELEGGYIDKQDCQHILNILTR